MGLFMSWILYWGLWTNRQLVEASKFSEVARSFNALYPFEEPDSPALNRERYAEFLAIRKAMSSEFPESSLADHLEKSTMEKPSLTASFSVAPFVTAFMESFSSGLEEAEMSPKEFMYYWFLEQKAIMELARGGNEKAAELMNRQTEGIQVMNAFLKSQARSRLDAEEIEDEVNEKFEGSISEDIVHLVEEAGLSELINFHPVIFYFERRFLYETTLRESPRNL